MADHAARVVTLSPADQEIKAAFAALARAFGGQDAVAAAFPGIRQQKVSDWCNPRLPEFAPLHIVAALEACTVGHPGHPHVTRLLARRAGFVLVEQHEDTQAVHPLAAIAAIAAEFGDVSRVYTAAAADGEVNDTERADALEAVCALEAATAALRVALGGMKVAARGAAGGGTKLMGKPTGTRRRAV